MSVGEATWLTARREISERIRSRAFRASTAVQIVVVLAIVVVSALTGGDGSEGVKVATVGEGAAAGKVAERQAEGFDLEVELRRAEDESTARALVVDGEVDGAIGGGSVLVSQDAPDQLAPLLQGSARTVAVTGALTEAGVQPGRAAQLASGQAVSVRTVGEEDEGGAGLAFVGALLLYIALLTYGYFVASGVVEEKSTRVVEVVLSATSPRRLLAGKILGIGVVGALQLALIAVVGVGAALLSNQVELPSTTGATAALVVLYFILGYAFYACAFAVAGSLVSRQEDAQSTTTPITLVLVAAYLVAISTTGDPDSSLASVSALLPPVAPLVVPAMAAEGALSALELVASVAAMMAATGVLIFIAGRVYERAVLLTGTPLKLSSVWPLLRSGAR